MQFFEELVADVLAHRQRVEQRTFLEDHAEIGANLHQRVLVHVVDAFAVDEDASLIRFEEAEDQPEDGRLAGTARPQEHLRVAGLEREADVVQDHLLVEREMDAVEDDDRPAEAQRFAE